MKHSSFWRNNPLIYIFIPLVFATVTAGAIFLLGRHMLAPYTEMMGWFISSQPSTQQPQDLLAQTEELEKSVSSEDMISVSTITYPSTDDKYGVLSITGTSVNAPLYYGDDNYALNKGAGTFKDDYRVGIPGEGKTILLAGHCNTFFNGLQQVSRNDEIKIETFYGTYLYRVTDMQVKDYQDESAYDFSRTDENLILYTCYPFDSLGFTAQRYFVYAEFVSGPKLDMES